jgi:hypothetical protein
MCVEMQVIELSARNETFHLYYYHMVIYIQILRLLSGVVYVNCRFHTQVNN